MVKDAVIISERALRSLEEDGEAKVSAMTIRRKCQHVPGTEHDWGTYDINPTPGTDEQITLKKKCSTCGVVKKKEVSEGIFEE